MAAWLKREFPNTSQQQTIGRQLEQMLASPAWEVVERLLKATEEKQIAALQPPNIKSHEEYIAGHYLIEGLRSARRAAEAVVQVARSADQKAAASAANRREGGG